MARFTAPLGALCAAMFVVGCEAEQSSTRVERPKIGYDAGPQMVRHSMDPVKGRALFIDKGCVICHAVNGVGGKAAPALDAPVGDGPVDPLEFAARMWRGAPAMIELQSIELGYAIYLEA
ncbi:MAG: c-type cytochrome, partial [Hyphococcus sp.]